MKEIIIIETSQEYFCNWLQDFTRNASSLNFLTQKGQLFLQTARPYRYVNDGNQYMRMDGVYVTDPNDGTQIAYPFPKVIELKVIPLNENRIEITVECNQPIVANYFYHLLDEIIKRWGKNNNLEPQLSEIKNTIITGFSDVKETQSTIICGLEKLSQIIHYGQIEQGEIFRILDAVRRALKSMQIHEYKFSKEISDKIKHANMIMDSKIESREKLEVTIPILPLILNYKVELGISSDVHLDTISKEILTMLQQLVNKSHRRGEG